MKSVRTVFLCEQASFIVTPLQAAGVAAVFADNMETAVNLLGGGDCYAVVAGQSPEFGPVAVRELGKRGLLLGVAAFGALDGSGGLNAASELAFFEAGADECFSPGQGSRLIAARFRAVLRRMFFHEHDDAIGFDGLELNITRRTVKLGTAAVDLTHKEFELLFELLKNPGRVIDRRGLLRKVWGPDYFGSPRTVDVHVSRLRNKLGGFGRNLRTVPCLGYKFERRPE
ncbi:MAG: response regulator transcription factor [Elusimicrobiaceae bacterium]|nr:response regulator transcription factor [Elusimicrobiaceae bacterium]